MKNHRKGVTLIELILVLAIIGIVINVGFSMNIFGAKTFAKGSDRYDLITKTNIVSEYITKNIRYAYGVQILDSTDTIPSSAEITSANPKDAYIFTTNVSGKSTVNYRDKNDTRALGEFDTGSLVFKAGNSSTDADMSLNYSITTSIKNESFSVDSGTVPINLLIQNYPEIIDNTGTSDGVAIRIMNGKPTDATISELIFKKPYPHNGKVGTAYSYTFNIDEVSLGSPSYTFSLSEATRLPTGLVLSSSGTLTGTPLEAGTFTFVVNIVDQSVPVKSGSKYFSIDISGTVVDNSAPSISNVNITKEGGMNEEKTSVIGIKLTADYEYLDPNDKVESDSIFSWWRSDKNNGTGLTPISGALSKTYTPVWQDRDNYIYVKVTPSNGDKIGGNTVYGDSVFCEFPVRIISSEGPTKPSINDNVLISYKKDKGVGTLTAEYIYQDNGKIEGASQYKWFRSKKLNYPIEEIVGANNKSYIITDSNYKIYYVEVTPVSSVGGIVGDTVRSLHYSN